MSDPAFLAQIHQQSFSHAHAWSEQSFRELLAQNNVAVYVNDLGAFLLTRMAANEMEVLTIAVVPACQRQGIASHLMNKAFSDARESSVASCFLEVDEGNKAAVSLYKKLGFETLAKRERYYKQENGERSDAIVMRLKL